MTLDILDGYLHAIGIGPTSLHPSKRMPVVWGQDTGMMLPMESIEHLNAILGLVMWLFDCIVSGQQFHG